MYNSEVSRGLSIFWDPSRQAFIGVQKLNFDNFTKCPSLKFFSAKTGKCALNLGINSKIG